MKVQPTEQGLLDGLEDLELRLTVILGMVEEVARRLGIPLDED